MARSSKRKGEEIVLGRASRRGFQGCRATAALVLALSLWSAV
jgi:hypothetical protein